jgi:hypothetical protein
MPITDLDVCNGAIGQIGGERIDALTEDSPLGAECAEAYPAKRDLLLSKHRWVFANRTVQLARIDPTPAGTPRAYLYQRPSDLVGAIHDFRATAAEADCKVSAVQTADGVAADAPVVWAEYTARVPEAGWPPWFRILVETAFAAHLAGFAQMRTLAATLEVRAFGNPELNGEGGLYLNARVEDGRNAPQRALSYAHGGPLLEARYGGGLGGSSWGPFSGPVTVIIGS